jgi:ferredoxin
MKHQVRVADSGEQFRCGEDQHLLQGMQSFRIGEPLLEVIPVGCRGGGCGVCRVRVITGVYEAKKMSRKHITEEDQAAGIVLACRVFPRSALDIEVLPVEKKLAGAAEAGGEP